MSSWATAKTDTKVESLMNAKPDDAKKETVPVSDKKTEEIEKLSRTIYGG